MTLTKSGTRYVTPSFIVQLFRRAPEGPFRYGVTASRKVGGAVQRNRAKRRLRALIREVLPDIGRTGMDYVLIARGEVLQRDFGLIVTELRSAIEALHKGV